MDVIFSNLAIGFQTALTWTNMLWVFIGGTLGTIIGMLPGLGPATGVAILIPIVFGMNPATALITMAAVYYGAMFGGSRASIMINVPGDASAIVSCFDGYPMSRKGKAGTALAISAIASFIGGMIGMVMLIILAQPVANAALRFGPPEMFALLLFSLIATITLSEGSLLKGLIAIAFGLMLSTVGIDPLTALTRFTYGSSTLQDGIDFLVVIIGLYAVTEVFRNLRDTTPVNFDTKSIGKVWVSWPEFKQCIWPMLRNSPLGFLVGVLPGMGGTIATFMTYALEKGISKHPEKFGKGAIEGLAAPEASNNACSCGALVPLLTLGIPGSGTTAVMLGALMLLGVHPGPTLFTQHPDIAWGVIASMLIGNIILIIINLPLAIPLVQLLRVPQRLMLPLIMGLALLGAYFLNYSGSDLVLIMIAAVVGFLFLKIGIPLPPLVLALILGSMTEQNFRNSMTLSDGNPSIFFTNPIALVFMILAGGALVFALVRNSKQQAKAAR
ncbi:MAG TPA: tripartite tricarboxylate transporter permease [Rectinemataceae bacterium]|nr:tripartite tricarboxylate transporter permease [Rectinemataceae bacterium]